MAQEANHNAEGSERLARFALETAVERVPNPSAGIGTDAVRSIGVILEVAAKRPSWLSDSTLSAIVEKVPPVLLGFKPADEDPRQPPKPEDEWALLPYRLSSAIVALTNLLDWSPDQKDLGKEASSKLEKAKKKAAKKLRAIAKELIETLEKAPVEGGLEVHPFFVHQLLVGLKAIEAARWESYAGTSGSSSSGSETFTHDARAFIDKLDGPLKRQAKDLLATHQLGLDNASDSVALAFSAAAIAVGAQSRSRYTRAALEACVGSYEHSAGWEQGRVVCQDSDTTPPHHRMTVPGAEVYAAIGEAMLMSRPENGFLDGGVEEESAAGILAILEIGLRIAADSKVDGEENKGWAVDQVLGKQVAELWPTAAVLKLAYTANEAIHRSDRQRVLEELKATPTWGESWPGWLDWSQYLEKSDPEIDNPAGILAFIDEKIVAPRNSEPGRTQSKAKVVLLFGPPGTTKTTIARAVAGGLQWPLVTLSPGNFIEGGLEELESRAETIFGQLQRLSRAVVILDECDELFRARAPVKGAESFRNASAFMTASMLPKLQDLHDRGRIVVFICTNFLSSIDPAMRRIGRIDHLIAVPPPDRGQRLVTIKLELGLPLEPKTGESDEDPLREAAGELADQTKDYIRGEVVNAARELMRAAPFSSSQAARKTAKKIGERRAQTIEPNKDDFKEFLKDRQELSEPHRNKGQ